MSKQKLGIGKKGGAALLSAALAVMMFPAAAIPAFAAEDEVVCDISKGSVTIQNDRLSYTDSSGNSETISFSSKTPIVVTGSTTENTITVYDYDDAPINMIFRDLSIDVTNISDGGAGLKSTCAVYFGGESTTWLQGRVNLTIEGQNTIKSLDYAGIGVPVGETLKIDGTGSLDVSSSLQNAGQCAPGIGSPLSNYDESLEPFLDRNCDISFGTIIIDGGTINASSDSTAGIGGGQRCYTGDIVINGGTITATSIDGHGAGIGCGQDSKIGSIIITGGDIVATGSQSGPGIGGGGMHTDSGMIFIMGGNITATGGDYGAGIGGSNTNGYGHGHAQLINVSGGTIKAYGGYTAAGIGGGGPWGLSDDITISGGDITAYGGDGSAAESVHTSGRGQQATEDGTQLTIYAPGAGLGNGGSQASIIDYTSGDNAGTTSASQTTAFGGKISISGGTVRGYSGTLDSDQAALITGAGYTLATVAIGDGGYVEELATEDDLAEACDKSYTGGVIYEDGTLVSADLAYATISGVTDQTYTGKALTPAPVVAIDDTTLEEGTDYTVDYANNTEVGLASLTVTGIGSFNGSQTANFLISAAATTPTTNPTPSTTKKASTSVGASKVKKIKVGKKQMTVTVKKVSGATGYQIAYRVKGKGKFKTKTAKSNGKLKIKKLKTGKKYEVKVTTLKKVGSTTYKAKTSKVKVSKKIK